MYINKYLCKIGKIRNPTEKKQEVIRLVKYIFETLTSILSLVI